MNAGILHFLYMTGINTCLLGSAGVRQKHSYFHCQQIHSKLPLKRMSGGRAIQQVVVLSEC